MSYRQTTKSRQTGHLVTVGTADDMGADPVGGKWVTVCEEHGFLINSGTLELACLAKPFDFCDACQWLHGGLKFTFAEYNAGLMMVEYGPRQAVAAWQRWGK